MPLRCRRRPEALHRGSARGMGRPPPGGIGPAARGDRSSAAAAGCARSAWDQRNPAARTPTPPGGSTATGTRWNEGRGSQARRREHRPARPTVIPADFRRFADDAGVNTRNLPSGLTRKCPPTICPPAVRIDAFFLQAGRRIHVADLVHVESGRGLLLLRVHASTGRGGRRRREVCHRGELDIAGFRGRPPADARFQVAHTFRSRGRP